MVEYPDYEEHGDPICRQVDADIWFPEPDEPNYAERLRDATKLCGECPYQTDCLLYALEANEEFGVWGGQTPLQRKRIKRNATKGAINFGQLTVPTKYGSVRPELVPTRRG